MNAVRLSMALAIAAFAVAPVHAAKPVGPEKNPCLAQSYNTQTHWNDAASDSVDIAVPRGFFEVTPQSAQVIPNEFVGLPSVNDQVAGQEIHWWWAGYSPSANSGSKATSWWRSVAPASRSSCLFTLLLSPEQRRDQAAAIQGFLDARDEKGLLDYMKAQPNRMASASADQVANGAVYAVLTRDDAFIGCNGRQVFGIDQEDPKHPTSGMKAAQVMTAAHVPVRQRTPQAQEPPSRGRGFWHGHDLQRLPGHQHSRRQGDHA